MNGGDGTGNDRPVPADRITLDHLAIAVERHEDVIDRYARELGGRFAGHGEGPGFSPLQVRFANGMKVEILEPYRTDVNDFLRRFLDRSGPGPHHLTYKVPDLRAAIERAEGAGFPVINVDMTYPDWMEGFLHPKIAHGIVVQLAQSSGDGGEWERQPPWFPTPEVESASLDRVVHWVVSLPGARTLFEDVLGGEAVDEGDAWVELGWPGTGCVRLVEARGAEVAWLAGTPGRVHHAALRVDDPAAIAGAVPLGDDSHEVAPEDNLGLRLILRPR